MNCLDILMTSPQYFYKKTIGTRQLENLFFVIGGLIHVVVSLPCLDELLLLFFFAAFFLLDV